LIEIKAILSSKKDASMIGRTIADRKKGGYSHHDNIPFVFSGSFRGLGGRKEGGEW
jgi:hypothetical protein